MGAASFRHLKGATDLAQLGVHRVHQLTGQVFGHLGCAGADRG
jgi:hypothetical protein